MIFNICSKDCCACVSNMNNAHTYRNQAYTNTYTIPKGFFQLMNDESCGVWVAFCARNSILRIYAVRELNTYLYTSVIYLCLNVRDVLEFGFRNECNVGGVLAHREENILVLILGCRKNKRHFYWVSKIRNTRQCI